MLIAGLLAIALTLAGRLWYELQWSQEYEIARPQLADPQPRSRLRRPRKSDNLSSTK